MYDSSEGPHRFSRQVLEEAVPEREEQLPWCWESLSC